MRKKLLVVLSFFVSVMMLRMPVFASEDCGLETLEMITTTPDGQTATTVFDLNELGYSIVCGDGIMPLIGIGEAELKNGHTMTYFNADGTDFYIVGGSTVTFTIKSKNSVHVVMGYMDSNGTKHQAYDGSGKTNTVTMSISTTGYYKMYVTNASPDTMVITGGSITF